MRCQLLSRCARKISGVGVLIDLCTLLREVVEDNELSIRAGSRTVADVIEYDKVVVATHLFKIDMLQM